MAISKKVPAVPVKKTAAVNAKLVSKLAAKVVPEAEEPKYKYPEKWKAPKKLSAAADMYALAREARLNAEKHAALLRVEEQALKHWLMQELQAQNTSTIGGRLYRVGISKKDVPKVKNWSLLYKAIVDDYQKHTKKKDGQEDGAFALLSKAIGKSAVTEAWEAGKQVPGVESFTVTDLSLNKL